MKLLLPLLCLLSLALGPVSAQDKRPVHVVTVEEGADALLPCGLSSGNSVDKFDWSKDSGGEEKEEVFLYDKGSYYGHGRSEQYQSQQFRGRVEFFKERLESGNASITIQNTRLEDNGTYTCVLFKPERHIVNIDLNVGAASLPHIQTLDDGITWRFLSCHTKGVPEPEVQWRNSAGQELAKYVPKNTDGHSHVELKLNVTRSDTYTCVVTQLDIHHQINNSIKVRFPGAASLPDIQTLDDGITWRFLSCHTKGVPEPEVQWRNSAGQTLATYVPKNTDGHSHVELKLNVTRSDTYICVVTQWDIHHQINNSIKVRFPGAASLPHIQTLDDGITWRFLSCHTKGVPEPEVQWRNSAGQTLATYVPKNTDGHSHVELKLNVTRSDTYTCVVTQLDIHHQINNSIKVRFPGAASLPHIQTLDDGITWRFLSCHTKGVPEPEVQWRNSAGQVLAKYVPKNKDGHSHVELKLNVTRSDTYTCVVTQLDIHHQINNSIKVSFPETFSVWQITAACLAVGLIVTIAVIAGLAVRHKNVKKAQINGSSPTRPQENVPSTCLPSQRYT